MQRWQQKQRQRAHHNMVEQAKPTIKRYSKSREKPNLSSSRNGGNTMKIFNLNTQTFKLIKPLSTALARANRGPTSTSSNLKKSESLIPKNGESMTSKKVQKSTQFRIKSKTHINRDSFHSPPISTFTEKTVAKRSKAKDDISIIHQINLKGERTVKYISKANNFLSRIEQRLKKMKGYDQKKEEEEGKQAKLYYKEIKEMYLSYDSATLTSNIANIDIEEIIECYAIELESHLNSYFLNPQKNYKKQKSKQYQIQKLLKKSLIQNKKPPTVTENSYIDDEINQTISLGSGSEEEQKNEEDQSSDIFNVGLQSIAYDLSCFNYQYSDQVQGSWGRKDIKNFIQLVMMAGKMEKETPILSYAYILRLLQVCPKDRINPKNWKNLTLITLIEASKIWDDQSLENHSFSKVIRPYTTLQINRLERHLLTFLNYKLQIEPKEYCESYFRLRKHAKQACKTAHLMHLSLQMIKKLQSGTKKCEKNLKQTYKKKLNESF